MTGPTLFSAAIAATVLLSAMTPTLYAFAPRRSIERATPTSSLLALPPPFIISPILKKMREEEQKKNIPLAKPDETAAAGPGLKIGPSAWKWPPIWPYDLSFFTPTVAAQAAQADGTPTQQMGNMASMLTGIANPNQPRVDFRAAIAAFDPIAYWSAQPASRQAMPLDVEARQKLQDHYRYYIPPGSSVLEIGACETCWLPADVELSRYVGVGANAAALDHNDRLTERHVVNLNKVVEDRDVNDDNLRRLAAQSFDVIVMHDMIEFLVYPREVFRSCWYLLQPGGRLICSFSGREAASKYFADAHTKAWRDYNDDQHLWMTGSFFQFSAGEGWHTLQGFDLSPASAKKMDKGDGNIITKLANRGKANNLFAVQAIKGAQDEHIDATNVEGSLRSLCWMMPTLEERDKALVVPRLARIYQSTDNENVWRAMDRNMPTLPLIYEALIKMDQYSFTFGMQSQMAADLVANPRFTGSETQLMELRRGLGLRTPTPEFWVPIGTATSNMNVEDKINLLAYLVPCFDGNEDLLQAFVTGLSPTYAVIRHKCPTMSDSDVELLGTELLASEILAGDLSRREFAAWLDALSATDLASILQARQQIRYAAQEELASYQEQVADEARQREDYRARMETQKQAARESRSMVFNPKTRKMETFEPPKQKK